MVNGSHFIQADKLKHIEYDGPLHISTTYIVLFSLDSSGLILFLPLWCMPQWRRDKSSANGLVGTGSYLQSGFLKAQYVGVRH